MQRLIEMHRQKHKDEPAIKPSLLVKSLKLNNVKISMTQFINNARVVIVDMIDYSRHKATAHKKCTICTAKGSIRT